MKTLKQFSESPESIPARTSWYLADLGLAQGKQELFTRQAPQKLKALREHALIESAINRRSRAFRVSDVQRDCPGVSLDMIRRVLKDLRRAGTVKCLGLGPAAQWQKTGK